jgi:hypothetical protein
MALHGLSTPVLRKVYFFHDIRMVCQTNHPAIVNLLETMLGSFPEPACIVGEATYTILCYENAAQFPVPLPRNRVRTDTLRLLTNTRLKYYRSREDALLYQTYVALPPVNEAALSVIDPEQCSALTQLELPEHYQPTFLRRYVLLLALGQLMQVYGFEPCHAGAVSTPDNFQQGALILGSSGSGKTTISIGCATIGCGLLGDDLVMLRHDKAQNSIRAYAISHEVAIRSGTLDLLPSLASLRTLPADQRDKRYCQSEQIRTGSTRTYTPIHLLCFPSLTDDASSTVIPLSKASTLQALVDECLGKKALPFSAQERVFAFLCQLAEQATGYQLAIARGSNDGPEIVYSLLTGKTL